MTGFTGSIEVLTRQNTNFRRVLYTSQHQQLVLMSLQPGEDIGLETHPTTDQFFRIEVGQGKVILDGVETVLTDGSAVIVPAGTNHNVVNTSQTEPLKLYTIYSPPHHADQKVHVTKADALADTEDHL